MRRERCLYAKRMDDVFMEEAECMVHKEAVLLIVLHVR